jgi:hypothetical protein
VLPKSLTSAILIVVTLVWFCNFVATLVIAGYKSDPLVHVAFMGTVGVVFGLTWGKKDDDGDDGGKHSKGSS